MATTKTTHQILDFVKNQAPEILEYVNTQELNTCGDAVEYFEQLRDNCPEICNIEIVYYTTAIAYLQKEDPSLTDSLALASDYGIQLNKLNSEVLASLHASQAAWEEYDNFLENLKEFINS